MTDEPPQQSRLQKMFGSKKEQKIKEEMPIMNVKGHKTFGKPHGKGSTHIHPDVSAGAMERQLYANEKNGPRMLSRMQRLKCWGALLAIGGWFTGCFVLVAYRLRSDDLELMEREVYEELKMKKEVQRFQERAKLQDGLKKADNVIKEALAIDEPH